MQQATVNVIEMENDSIARLVAFDASDEGRQEAKDRFASLVKSHDEEASESDIQEFIEEGYYETGLHQVFLVESANA